jgi:TrmH family RNA methyltransferase
MLSNITVVLQQPERALNIGAAARAMKNSGVTALTLVSPLPKKLDAAYRMATNATDVLDGARIVGSLAEALADVQAAFAVTRRGDLADASVLTPRGMAGHLSVFAASNRAALVFGPEHRGLSNAEIGLCQRIVTIPSSPSCPSFNLSHAVSILCYELYCATNERPVSTEAAAPMPQSGEIEAVLSHAQETLLKIGFLKEQNPGRLQPMLRSLIARAGVTARELRVLRGILAQMDWVAEKAGLKKG